MAYSHPCICLAFDVFVIHALLGELLFREDKEKKKKDTPTTSTDYLCCAVAMDGYPKVIHPKYYKDFALKSRLT